MVEEAIGELEHAMIIVVLGEAVALPFQEEVVDGTLRFLSSETTRSDWSALTRASFSPCMTSRGGAHGATLQDSQPRWSE